MTFYVGYALSLFGRDVDRLSHVLVSEDFESHDQFFYPPPQPVSLVTKAGKPVCTDRAEIDLVDIPFVRLREHVDATKLAGSFQRSIAQAQERLQAESSPPEVTAWLGRRSVSCAGRTVKLSPQEFALYGHLLLLRKLRGDVEVPKHGYQQFWQFATEAFREELWDEAREKLGVSFDVHFEAFRGLECEDLADEAAGKRFNERLCDLRRKIREAFVGRPLIQAYLDVQSVTDTEENRQKYGVSVPPDRIQFAL